MTSIKLEIGVFKTKMRKTPLLVFGTSLCILIGSCSTTKPLHYSVDIMNGGKEGIKMEPFVLADSPRTTVSVGEAFPGGRVGEAPFYCRPNQIIEIHWSSIKTGQDGRASVQLNLPKEFTKKNGSCIVFHIKPEEKKVEMTYEILDPKTRETSIFR